MNKEIQCDLSTKSLNQAIREIEKYQRWLDRKTEQFAEELAKELQQLAQSGFSSATVDDIVDEGMRQANVNVTIESVGENIRCVVANGEDAIWVEFGAGVHYNGSAGSSPHPKGGELGFTIGGYGLHQGRKDSWSFTGEDGKRHRSHGTPAQMPFYTAYNEVISHIEDVARRVFA